jgi:ribosomal protein L31
VSGFTGKCLEFLWLMCNQQPPMSLQWPEQGELFDTTLYKYYKGKGFNNAFNFMFHVKICVNKNKTYDVDCTLCCHTFYMGTTNPLHKIGPL